jgi:hypothetical protein
MLSRREGLRRQHRRRLARLSVRHGPARRGQLLAATGGRTFRAIAPGEPVFFRLKSPLSRIGGLGRLARYETLPVKLAWDCVGPKNGTPDFATMLARTRMYARKCGHLDVGPMHAIGCMMISDPVFFATDDAVDQPASLAGQIVSGKTYSLDHGEGRRIWDACLARIQPPALAIAAMDEPRYGTPTWSRRDSARAPSGPRSRWPTAARAR